MADSSPTNDPHAAPGDRTAKIEELLLSGLDYYFAGEYDRALHGWTRVLFLDRGHTRARAYIERARGALSERQRESEELIQRGVAAFEQGQTGVAREMLSTAVAHGGPHDVALALLERLSRLDGRTPGGDEAADEASSVRDRRPAGSRHAVSLAWVVAAVMIAALCTGALYVASSSTDLLGLQSSGAAGRAARVAAVPETLPLPRSADIALSDARALFAGGHVKEALVALERIKPGDPAHPEAQRLRAEIQSALLAGLPSVGGDAGGQQK